MLRILEVRRHIVHIFLRYNCHFKIEKKFCRESMVRMIETHESMDE